MNHKVNKQLQSHFCKQIQEKKILGAAYEVSWRGSVIAQGESGTADSFVDIQSITKLFTAVAILQLREQGELSFHDPAAKFLPEFAVPEWEKITVMHLLTHTSGLVALKDAFPDRAIDWEAELSADSTKEEWIPAIMRKGLFFAAGSKWEYSKAGFCILGEIIQRITGQRAEDYIKNHILLPCGMRRSFWKEERDDIWAVIPQTAAGLFTPMDELVQFGTMLAAGGDYQGKQILREASVRELETNQLPSGMRDYCWDHAGKYVAYGAGCPVYRSEYEPQWKVGENTIYHEGAGASMLVINRAKQLAAAWSTPFSDPTAWCEEAVKGTATVLWQAMD